MKTIGGLTPAPPSYPIPDVNTRPRNSTRPRNNTPPNRPRNPRDNHPPRTPDIPSGGDPSIPGYPGFPPTNPGHPGDDGSTTTPVTRTPLEQAAIALGQALAGNPFITQEGKAQLSSGLTPGLNTIQNQFFRYSDIELQEALKGLISSGGTTVDQQQQYFQLTRPATFR